MFKLLVCILSAILAAAHAGRLPSSNLIESRADRSLANFLLTRQPRAVTQTSLTCFPIYLPVLDEIANQWSREYESCLTTAESNRTDILEKASAQQKDISTSAAGVCNHVQICDSVNDTLGGLDCFGYLSTNTLSTIYTVSNNASETAAIVREQINIIDINSERCCNASDRNYVESSAEVYDALEFCLKYGPPEVVVPSSSTASPQALNESRNVQLIAAPRRTPTSSVLTKESQGDGSNPAPRSRFASLVNNWLHQSEDQANV